MNKMKFVAFFSAAVLTFSATQAQTVKVPAPSPTQTIKQNFALGEIDIEYSRPLARGRVIFGDLVPFDKVWRTGANSATKITFSDDVNFGGKAVKAGTYALYTIPGKSSWTVMLYNDLKMGGNVASYNAENEVVRITVRPRSVEPMVQSFTIGLEKVTSNSATLELKWEYTRVPIKITTEIDEKIMSSIDKAMNVDSRPYFQAASYYYENDKDLKQAKEWAVKAIEQNPKAFWVRMLKAKIELKMGENQAAISTANEVIELAKAAQNEDYVRMAKKLIKQAK